MKANVDLHFGLIGLHVWRWIKNNHLNVINTAVLRHVSKFTIEEVYSTCGSYKKGKLLANVSKATANAHFYILIWIPKRGLWATVHTYWLFIVFPMTEQIICTISELPLALSLFTEHLYQLILPSSIKP